MAEGPRRRLIGRTTGAIVRRDVIGAIRAGHSARRGGSPHERSMPAQHAAPRPSTEQATDRLGRLSLRRLLHRAVPDLQRRADPLRRLCRLHRMGHHRQAANGSASRTSPTPSTTSGSGSPSRISLLYGADHRPRRHHPRPRSSRSTSTSAGRSRALARTLFFAPNVVSATVIGLVWVWLLDTQFGLVNHYLGIIGIPDIPWLTSTHWSLIGVSIASIWWDLGLAFVLFLAALQDVPQGPLRGGARSTAPSLAAAALRHPAAAAPRHQHGGHAAADRDAAHLQPGLCHDQWRAGRLLVLGHLSTSTTTAIVRSLFGYASAVADDAVRR